jgi:hypothetical protein
VIYFKPGSVYLGVDFFFSRPEPYCIIETGDDEISSAINPDSEDDTWLKRAVLNFLVVCAHYNLTDIEVCNFLIHPSIKINDHNIVADKIAKILNDVWQSLDGNDEVIVQNLKTEWDNLYSTKPEIKPFDEIKDCIKDLTCLGKIKIYVLNSRTDTNVDVKNGYSIVIGGNILGRGITFPNLQTVYYTRTAKIIQADTYWQHCRMFGYDRDRGLIRIFIPFIVFKRFQELNESQKVLVKQISEKGLDAIHIVCAEGTTPTRRNVLDSNKQNYIDGGVNYFTAYPVNNTLEELDTILLPFDGKGTQEISIDTLVEILSKIETEDKQNDWNPKTEFVDTVKIIANIKHLKRRNCLSAADTISAKEQEQC